MRVIFLGPPGSGKGTQAKRLRQSRNTPQLSTGDLLRTAIREGTAIGRQVQSCMDAGDLVPDDLVVNLVLERIAAEDCRDGYILDGFPRTVNQAERLDEMLGSKGSAIDAVVNFAMDPQLVLERLVGRRVCPNGHGEWHLQYNPPDTPGRCETCGDPLIQREDDHEDRIVHRLEAYRKDTEPLILYYRERGLLHDVNPVGEFDGITKQIEAVFDAVLNG